MNEGLNLYKPSQRRSTTETKRCPRCRGKMAKSKLEIETTDAGVPVLRIPGIEFVAYVCGKCGYIELYDRGRMKP